MATQFGLARPATLNALIDRYQWLQGLPNPATALQSIADVKIFQWANEAARRLNALELREYITPQHHTLLMAVIHDARGHVRGYLTRNQLLAARWERLPSHPNGQERSPFFSNI